MSVNFWVRTLQHFNIFVPYFDSRRSYSEKCDGLAEVIIAGRRNAFGSMWMSTRSSLLTLHDMCRGKSIVAHNGLSFDFHVLDGSLDRACLGGYFDGIDRHDSIRIFRKMWVGEKTYGLSRLFTSVFGRVFDAHEALNDCIAVALLMVAGDIGHCAVPARVRLGSVPDLRSPMVLGGVGKKSLSKLKELGIYTIDDLKQYCKTKSLKGVVAHWKKVERNLFK